MITISFTFDENIVAPAFKQREYDDEPAPVLTPRQIIRSGIRKMVIQRVKAYQVKQHEKSVVLTEDKLIIGE